MKENLCKTCIIILEVVGSVTFSRHVLFQAGKKCVSAVVLFLIKTIKIEKFDYSDPLLSETRVIDLVGYYLAEFNTTEINDLHRPLTYTVHLAVF